MSDHDHLDRHPPTITEKISIGRPTKPPNYNPGTDLFDLMLSGPAGVHNSLSLEALLRHQEMVRRPSR